MSPFHGVPIGKAAPEVVNAIVEIPRGSHNKYEFDEKLGIFKLDRVLYSPVHYPLDYGFIPETRSEDGDHLDVLVMGSDPVFPGCMVEVRPVAMLQMIDGGDADFKILAVQTENPRYEHIKNLPDVEAHNNHLLKEIAHFMKVYKELQGKEVQVMGWQNVQKAHEEIRKAQKAFLEESK